MATATAAPEKKLTDHKMSSAADQMADLDRQIEALRQKKLELNQTAVHEQKLRVSDAKKALQAEEDKLAELTGKPANEGPKVRKERRPSITDEALKDQLLKVLAKDGVEGLNAKQLADKMNIDPIRVRKFIKDHPKALKRVGQAAGTKFFLP